ncbi:MAG: ATP-binding cassette domain-containing protein [Chloroflexi bacterium]|nr:ATP-binding cassette domain-containing protein [Chloroflexota bacterium]
MATDSMVPALAVEGLSKNYGAVQAVRGVDLEVFAGEIVGLVGDNGSGKSTLVRCVAGSQKPDEGTIRINGILQTDSNPHKVRLTGLEVVHQDLSLVDTLDIAANFFLGREKCIEIPGVSPFGFLDYGYMKKFTNQALADLGVNIGSIDRPVGFLSGGQRQMVAVARAITWGESIIILDEPAASLGVEQTKLVLDLVRRLADRNRAVVFISHNMQHVMGVTNRIVVLRLGRKVGDLRTRDTSAREIVELITGSDLGNPV